MSKSKKGMTVETTKINDEYYVVSSYLARCKNAYRHALVQWQNDQKKWHVIRAEGRGGFRIFAVEELSAALWAAEKFTVV